MQIPVIVSASLVDPSGETTLPDGVDMVLEKLKQCMDNYEAYGCYYPCWGDYEEARKIIEELIVARCS